MKATRHEPDGLEKGLRLGCGGLVGLLLFGRLFARWALRAKDPTLAYLCMGAGTVLFAVLALRQGDRFWQRFGDWEGFLPPRFLFALLGALLLGAILYMRFSR